MNVDVLQQPTHGVPSRLTLEAPRPRYPTRNGGYRPRSSPLAGPSTPSESPVNNLSNDSSLNAEKTRTGAIPSRISAPYPTPPSSLRNVSLSRTPSPTRPSELSTEIAASSAITILGGAKRRASESSAGPSTPYKSPSLSPPPRAYLRASSSPSLPVKPDTSPDPARNWLSATSTSPPPFSRTRIKGVVMPVKATSKRPRTAPASTRPTVTFSSMASSPPERHVQRVESVPNLDSARMEQTKAMLQDSPSPSRRSNRLLSVPSPTNTKPSLEQQRRRRSLITLSSPPRLREVREEMERDNDIDGSGARARGNNKEQESKVLGTKVTQHIEQPSKTQTPLIDETLTFPPLTQSTKEVHGVRTNENPKMTITIESGVETLGGPGRGHCWTLFLRIFNRNQKNKCTKTQDEIEKEVGR